MGVLRLVVCVSGVYGAFLLWAIAQERLSKSFPSRHPHHNPLSKGDKFPSPLFFNWCQALASASCAAVYLLISAWRDGKLNEGVWSILGLRRLLGSEPLPIMNGNGHAKAPKTAPLAPYPPAALEASTEVPTQQPPQPRPWNQTLPGLLLQVSLFQTLAGPIGFHALKSISYPTMVLAKSCKLIPVLLLNVLLYRRKFGGHKYLVVALVSAGISMFMGFGGKSKGGSNSAFGLSLLLVNLLIDGLTNSTQDQIFSLYPSYSGQQMMFIMAFITLTLLTPVMLLPLPVHPWAVVSGLFSSRAIGVPSGISFSPPIFLQSIRFLTSHPTALPPLGAYAALGGLGQIFIFETIAHFGSLTLVMITVTRKLFTMLLSVFVFGHKLTAGQWAGVAVVFAGIGVEAGFKRREAARRVKQDKKRD